MINYTKIKKYSSSIYSLSAYKEEFLTLIELKNKLVTNKKLLDFINNNNPLNLKTDKDFKIITKTIYDRYMFLLDIEFMLKIYNINIDLSKKINQNNINILMLYIMSCKNNFIFDYLISNFEVGKEISLSNIKEFVFELANNNTIKKLNSWADYTILNTSRFLFNLLLDLDILIKTKENKYIFSLNGIKDTEKEIIKSIYYLDKNFHDIFFKK